MQWPTRITTLSVGAQLCSNLPQIYQPNHTCKSLQRLGIYNSSRAHSSMKPTKMQMEQHEGQAVLVTSSISKRCVKLLTDFKDFQNYARPLCLLPATEVKASTDSSLEALTTSFNASVSKSLYKIKLQTSNTYGSDLTDINAGVLLCLIGENSESILQRIPASSIKDHHRQLEGEVDCDLLRFQRGSVDEFTFTGPRLGKIVAIWIGIESGRWRVGGANLTVCEYHPPSKENDKKDILNVGFRYDFEAEDVLLGEGSDMSMVEIRPSLVTEFSGENFILLTQTLLKSSSPESYNISNEESMKEYADLKFSLLSYDALLIVVGSSIASFFAGENAAFAFLTGGICGFLYLLLLQRSVDGLPVQKSILMSRTEKLDQAFGSFKGSVSVLVLAFGFAIIAVKYASGDSTIVLTPKELLFGMTGFFLSKISVVLAALRPITMGLEREQVK